MGQTAGKRCHESEIYAPPRHGQDSRSAAVAQIDMPREQSSDVHRSGSYEDQFGINTIFGEKSLFLGDPKRRDRSLHRRVADNELFPVLSGAGRSTHKMKTAQKNATILLCRAGND